MKGKIKILGTAMGLGMFLGPLQLDPSPEALQKLAPTFSPAKAPELGQVSLAESVEIEPASIAQTTPATTAYSESMQAQQALDGEYVHRVMKPALEAAGVSIVQPINEDVEPVNQPNQIIIAVNGGTCAAQFNIGEAQNKPGFKSVFIDVFGNPKLLHDGRTYGKAAYGGALGHQEGFDILPHDFASDAPEEAVSFMVSRATDRCETMRLQGMLDTSPPLVSDTAQN